MGVLYAAAIVLSFVGATRGDKVYHYAQIHLFLHGDWRVLDRYLKTIPGYYAVVALALRATLALWLVLAVWIFLGIAAGRFFL